MSSSRPMKKVYFFMREWIFNGEGDGTRTFVGPTTATTNGSSLPRTSEHFMRYARIDSSPRASSALPLPLPLSKDGDGMKAEDERKRNVGWSFRRVVIQDCIDSLGQVSGKTQIKFHSPSKSESRREYEDDLNETCVPILLSTNANFTPLPL